MSIIECRELGKDVAGRILFESVSFSVDEGQKLGLIGPNGCGKTSFLRILMGLDEDHSGRVLRDPAKRLAYLPQVPRVEAGLSAMDYLLSDVLAMRRRMEEMEERMASGRGSEAEALLVEYGRIREEYEGLGGDAAEERVARSMKRAGLGALADTPANSLSGGELNILCLLKALLLQPDLLILDEPGNHLDLWGQAWLEDFLSGLPIALILVSHNRWLLDRVVGRILSFEDGVLRAYSGNYSAARLERLRRAAAQGAGWQADRKRVERLEALVKRFEIIARSRPDPAWGKRLRARRSQLERERLQARTKPGAGQKVMDLDFGESLAKSTYAMIVSDYSKAYGERLLLERTGFDLLRGEKAALVGPNGCGKTSFLRDLVESKSWDAGPLRVPASMKLAYISQNQDVFEPGRSLVGCIESLGARPDEARKLLRRFLFNFEDMEKTVESLSGGELNRLQLARAVYQGASLLVLDEPTNHLDIPSREALEEALEDFDGTVLLVSHDRYLLEAVTDRVIEIRDGRFRPYEGSFSEYWRDIGADRSLASLSARGGMGGRAASLARARLNPSDGMSSAGAGVELTARIESLEKDKAAAEKAAEAAIAREDFATGRHMAAEAGRLGRLIDKLYRDLCG